MPDTWITQAETDATMARITRSLAVLKVMIAVQCVLSLACLLAVWCL
jgi:hypothetical protein